MESLSGNESVAEVMVKLRSDDQLRLTKGALLTIVERYLDGRLTVDELQQLGDLLEFDPIEYVDESPSGVVAQVVFEMATPEANGPIDRNAALRWRELLR